MEFRHLRYFLAVADALHFTKAAERLPVSQPALSAQVKQLEQEVGVPLFDRVGRSVHLTRAGAIFREHARRALWEMELAQTAIAEMEGVHRGTVTLGVVHTVNAYLVPEIVARFSMRHPQVALKVEELPASDIEAGVTGGVLDLGISFLPTQAERLDGPPLFEEEFVLIASPRHRFATHRQVALSALAEEPMILLPEAYCTRRMIDEACRQAGVQPNVAVEMNSIEGILATVRTSHLVTILPRLSLGLERSRILRGIALKKPAPRRTVALLWRKGGYHDGPKQALAELVRALVKEYWC